jgi:hypothetical protein
MAQIDLDNERKYLTNLANTGDAGKKEWAINKAKSYGISLAQPAIQTSGLNMNNETKYLTDVYNSGDAGKQTWATNQAKFYGVTINPTSYNNTSTSNNTSNNTSTSSNNSKSINLPNEHKYLRKYYLTGTPGERDWALSQAKIYGIDITKDYLGTSEDRSNELVSDLAEMSAKAQIDALNFARQNSINTLNAERSKIAPKYYDLRNQAGADSQLSAKNFAEFMANRGGTSSGVSAQAELSRQGNLQGAITNYNLQEQQAYNDLDSKISAVQLDFEAKVANAKSQAEIDKLTKQLQISLDQIKIDEARRSAEAEQKWKSSESEKDRAWQDSNSLAERQWKTDESAKDRLLQAQESARDRTARAQSDAIKTANASAKSSSTTEKKVNYKENPEFLKAYEDVLNGREYIHPTEEERLMGVKPIPYKRNPKQMIELLKRNYEQLVDEFELEGFNALMALAQKQVGPQ